MAIGITYEVWALLMDENEFEAWSFVGEFATAEEAYDLANIYANDGIDACVDRKYI